MRRARQGLPTAAPQGGPKLNEVVLACKGVERKLRVGGADVKGKIHTGKHSELSGGAGVVPSAQGIASSQRGDQEVRTEILHPGAGLNLKFRRPDRQRSDSNGKKFDRIVPACVGQVLKRVKDAPQGGAIDVSGS